MPTRAAFVLLLAMSMGAHGADEPKWLKDARAREIKSQKTTEIRSADGWFRATTPGKLVNPIVKESGSYSLELDVGGDGGVHCEVYPEGVDLANALRVTLDGAIKNIEATQGKIEVRALEGRDAGAFGAVPYISLTWLYRVSTPKGAMVGALKQIVMEKGKHAVYCAQNDLGFTRTFVDIARAFAATLRTQEPPGTPHYTEIATVSLTGARIGFIASSLERDAEGDTRVRQLSAMLIATDDGAVQSQDSTQIHWLRGDGTLINAASSEVSNGELTNNLSLNDVEGTWTVEGEVQGKKVKTTLPKGSKPGNWVAQARELRTLLAEPNAVGREHSMGIWLADNPERISMTKTRILAKRGDKHFTARAEVEGMVADLVLEKSTGMTDVADIKMGPVAMKLERVYVDGTF
jgi:hypothetical protein